jgi:hypothetical protein
VSGWLDIATIQAAVDNDVLVRPHSLSHVYVGFADPSGGVKDSFTCGVAHSESGIAVLDCLAEVKAPFSPAEAIHQIAAVLKQYALSSVTGDRYASQFTVDAFAAEGITYKFSERTASEIYVDALPMFVSGKVRLIDNKRVQTQLASLERKTQPGGRDKVDHPRGQHDDAAVASCGALVLAVAKATGPRLLFG